MEGGGQMRECVCARERSAAPRARVWREEGGGGRLPQQRGKGGVTVSVSRVVPASSLGPAYESDFPSTPPLRLVARWCGGSLCATPLSRLFTRSTCTTPHDEFVALSLSPSFSPFAQPSLSLRRLYSHTHSPMSLRCCCCCCRVIRRTRGTLRTPSLRHTLTLPPSLMVAQ